MDKKKTLILGASGNPSRYSYLAINRLVGAGHPVVAVGLKPETVAGVRIDTGKKDYDDIDTVTLYLNPQRQREYYDYIIGLQPKRVIFNPGTENPELYDLLQKHHIKAETACTLVLVSINQY